MEIKFQFYHFCTAYGKYNNNFYSVWKTSSTRLRYIFREKVHEESLEDGKYPYEITSIVERGEQILIIWLVDGEVPHWREF